MARKAKKKEPLLRPEDVRWLRKWRFKCIGPEYFPPGTIFTEEQILARKALDEEREDRPTCGSDTFKINHFGEVWCSVCGYPSSAFSVVHVLVDSLRENAAREAEEEEEE